MMASGLSLPRCAMRFLLERVTLWLALIWFGASGPLWAQGPTTAAPRLLLPVASATQLADVLETAAALDADLQKTLAADQDLADHGKIGQVSPKHLEGINLENMQFRRAGQRLSAAGELSGMDVDHRADQHQRRLMALAQKRILESDAARVAQQQLKQVDRDLERKLPTLLRVRKLLDRKAPEEAQQLFWQTIDPLDEVAMWYGMKNMPSRPALWTNLEPYRIACMAAAQKLWRDKALQENNKALAESTPDFSSLIERAEAAAASIGRTGTADLAGQVLQGPAAVEALGRTWQEAIAATLKVRGLMWYNRRLGGSSSSDSLVLAQPSFNQNMAVALGKIVSADATRVAPTDAAAVYRDYLARLAPLMASSADPAVAAAVEKPLEALAARSPPLAAEVRAYRDATENLLKWRSRSALAAIHARQKQFPAVANVVRTMASRLSGGRGPLLLDERGMMVSRWTDPMPDMIARLVPLEGKSATATDLLAVLPQSPTGPMAIGDYQQPLRSYVRVTPAAAAEAVHALASDLLSSESQPPLTLSACLALEGARQGDLAAAGGPITRLGLLAWGEHFIRLPAAQRGIIRLDPIASDMVAGNELVVLVLIEAQWMAGRYYFVDVPAASTAGPKN